MPKKSRRVSLWFVLLCQFPQSVLSLFDIFERELAGFHQVGHNRLRAAPKKSQQLVDESTLGGIARHHRLENMCVADFSDAADRFLAFQPVYGSLHRSIRGPVLLRKSLLNLP